MKSYIYSLLLLIFLLLLTNCEPNPVQITQATDYNIYLELVESDALQIAKTNLKFWEEKLEKEPGQFPYLAKLAASHSQLFSQTGDIEQLIKTEVFLLVLNEKTNFNNAAYLRSLSRNYISQHRFNEALDMLKKAKSNGENMNATNKMLFDVHLELGDTSLALLYLERIKDLSDFDYLIRLAKWQDFNGELDLAIKYMEKATAIAEASNISSFKSWSYTNLADFYGHSGAVKKSYNYYLKALQLNPENNYAKKGIAWIVYSYERNPQEGMRILQAITRNYNSPDIYLLQGEIAAFMKDYNKEAKYLKQYAELTKNKNYGDMYNTYNIELYSENESQLEEALALAKLEVKNRPTAHSYDLLAWIYYKKGNVKKALTIMEEHVAGYIFEPTSLFHLALVYKANNRFEKVKELKQELEQSKFEVGPVMALEISRI